MELLIVLVILILLLALVFPALHQVRSRSHTIACLHNPSQWGKATHLYAVDHDDWLPKDGAPNGGSKESGWYVDLPRALGLLPYHAMEWRTNANIDPGRTLFICPANDRRSNGRNLFHYCLNQHVNRTGAGNQVRLGTIANPANAVWMFDNGRLAAVAQFNNVHTNLHLKGAQFLFLDGHVARYNAQTYWNFKRNQAITNHPELNWFP